jgi:hypothetical protein
MTPTTDNSATLPRTDPTIIPVLALAELERVCGVAGSELAVGLLVLGDEVVR